MLKTFHFQIAVKEVKDMGQEGVMIQGYASTPDVDRYKDIVEPTAFAEALKMFMKNPTLLRSHDTDRPCGNVTQAMITDKGLWVSAMVTEEETKEDVLQNRMRAFSIGYIPLESTLQHEDGSPFNAEQDSPWDSDMIRVIKKLDLVEISIVSTPANGNALFTIASSVKLFFNELVTKSMKINKKENDQEIEGEKIEKEKIKEKTEENPEPGAPDVPAEEVIEEGVDKEKGEKTDEEKATEEKKETDEPAAEGAEEEVKTDLEKETGEKPEDKTEKGGETPLAENGEVVKTDEEPIAEVETEEKPAEASEKVEAIGVTEELAKSLPDLVNAGFIAESKEAGAASCSKEIVGLISKILVAFKAAAEKVVDLEAKLEKQPDKLALKVSGQFKEELSDEEKKKAESENGSAKQASAEFKRMFGIND